MNQYISKVKTLLLCTLTATTLIACEPAFIIPIQQGVILLEEDVKKVKVGMSKLEVVSIIGEPAIIDSLQGATWLYVYYSKTGPKDPLRFLREGDKNKTNRYIKNIELQFDDEIVTVITYELEPLPDKEGF